MSNYSLWIFIVVFLGSCNQEPAVPKPRTYPKITFPERSYSIYKHPKCNYRFEIPDYSTVIEDSLFFGEKAPNECWINILFPDFEGQLYCSYYPVKDKKDLERLIEDGYKIASRHTVKADYINEIEVQNSYHVKGRIFEIDGPVASGFQFYLTDSLNHFFNASLYINTEVRQDSLAPVLAFLKSDMYRMIETFRWE